MTPEELLRDGRIDEALVALQNNVRKNAADSKLRVFLFQLLSVLGRWDKALSQLKLVGQLDAGALLFVQLFREVLQCEALRSDIFSGVRSPLFFGEPESWMAQLVEALRVDALEQSDQAEQIRVHAFEAAPATRGLINGTPFEWIADADGRLGPILEAIVNGRYYFIPFQRIKRITLDAPMDLRDVIWMPATFEWSNEGQATGYVPTRYVDTVLSDDAALLLSRRTEWQGNRGLGQRLLVTDAAEYPIMDVRTIELFSVQA